SMLVFLSIFCAMLIGDAGYGLIFTLITLGLRLHCRDEKKVDGLNVLLLMSVCTFVYGALSGSWFAIETTKLPPWLQGWRWLRGEQKHVQIICFFLAGTQMSLARVWRACLRLLKPDDGNVPKGGEFRAIYAKVRDVLGHLGWGVFLWGNYGLAKLLVVDGKAVNDLGLVFRILFAVGFVLILLFSIDWSSVITVIYMPFSFINTFVDTLSYIRLFAVGVSSFYIANAFNGMAGNLLAKGGLGVVCGLLVLLLGHLLNICLALMGVLVHGIRLNALEFSGHMDISWSGQPYHPLQSCENTK
ncbi:MAG: hypothetical protein IJJ33_12910, partial [Victivallales bacterium]|nr:hypothetical protein [Victivallales bacterium]